MRSKAIQFFTFSAGVLFFITASAKLISASGTAGILKTSDPILHIPFRDVFWVVGACELVISLICLLTKRHLLQTVLIVWIATAFLIYRIGVSWVGYPAPCHCLGNLTDALHIPPQIADTAMKIILTYLLLGSCAALCWLWKEKRKVSSLATVSEKTAGPAS